jgi:hypothetical protein
VFDCGKWKVRELTKRFGQLGKVQRKSKENTTPTAESLSGVGKLGVGKVDTEYAKLKLR